MDYKTIYDKYHKEVNYFATKLGLDNSDLSVTGGEWDAFRHAYASARMTQDIGLMTDCFILMARK